MFKSILKSIKNTGKEVMSVVLDQVLTEKILDTPYGYGNFIAQIKLDRHNRQNYILLKISGGDTTIYMRLEREGALDLRKIIEEVYPKD
jgi:hypothetical protein